MSPQPPFFLPADLGDVRIFLSQCPQCFVSEDVDPGGGMLMLLESAHMINATSETFQIAGCLPESREAGWFHLRSLTFYQLSKFFSGKQSTAEIN